MTHEVSPRFEAGSRPESTVSCWCEGAVLLNESVTVPVMLAFHYAADEPYAVRMVVDTGVTPLVEWVFARDLLAEGLVRPTGLADVQTWPVPHRPDRLEAGSGAVHIRISSPGGTTVLSAPATELRNFLDRTFQRVATGTESRTLRLDESLAWLMTARRSEGGST
ncbi:SsgA family sporulation/cell division regulator [Streptomyces chromofuscus]|uniref:SsgA family sporulation/cell division regulator n=1 Tax=Streptomyces chromofuscus TaxID=42881 RepID=UPI0016722682|nr:SsgA family sporulation/cell division regulator [Streptomyces chromofuscus]GGT03317.1 sporulation-specific cell division protein SsgB [Streptomyces chromofuscus]